VSTLFPIPYSYAPFLPLIYVVRLEFIFPIGIVAACMGIMVHPWLRSSKIPIVLVAFGCCILVGVAGIEFRCVGHSVLPLPGSIGGVIIPLPILYWDDLGIVDFGSCVPVLHGFPIAEASIAWVVGSFVVGGSGRLSGGVFVPSFGGTVSASVVGYPEEFGWDARLWPVFATCWAGLLLASRCGGALLKKRSVFPQLPLPSFLSLLSHLLLD
jgi:hypothetical protein